MASKAWGGFVRFTDILIQLFVALAVLFGTLVITAITLVYAYCVEITVALVVFHFVRKYW